MKNYFLCLLLFFLGSTFASGGSYELAGVAEGDIINSKTGIIIYSFSVPQKYIAKNGSLIIPIEITLLNESSKTAIFAMETKELSSPLPYNTPGKYELIVSIGEFVSSKKIELQ